METLDLIWAHWLWRHDGTVAGVACWPMNRIESPEEPGLRAGDYS